jgi:prophage antirepressor-like protein
MEIIEKFKNDYNIAFIKINNDIFLKASEVAEALSIKTIYITMKDFDETDKVVIPIDIFGGKKNTIFLTKTGVLKFLFRSKQPIALKFQNLICNQLFNNSYHEMDIKKKIDN